MRTGACRWHEKRFREILDGWQTVYNTSHLSSACVHTLRRGSTPALVVGKPSLGRRFRGECRLPLAMPASGGVHHRDRPELRDGQRAAEPVACARRAVCPGVARRQLVGVLCGRAGGRVHRTRVGCDSRVRRGAKAGASSPHWPCPDADPCGAAESRRAAPRRPPRRSTAGSCRAGRHTAPCFAPREPLRSARRAMAASEARRLGRAA